VSPTPFLPSLRKSAFLRESALQVFPKESRRVPSQSLLSESTFGRKGKVLFDGCTESTHYGTRISKAP